MSPFRTFNRHRRVPRPAFVLAEALALILILLLAVALLSIASAHRQRAHLADSFANLQRLGAGFATFAGDDQGRVATFNWRANIIYTDGGISFPPAPTDVQAAANQAVAILRRRAGRPDIQPISGWLPHLFNSHLVLADHLDWTLPTRTVVAPEDTNRLAWQRHSGDGFFSLPNRPGGAGASNADKRWPFSSSYELGPAFYAPDAQVGNIPTIASAGAHHLFLVGTYETPFGRRLLSEVRFPSHKAMLYEQFARSHGSRAAFFAYHEARPAVLFVDGSVSVRSMAAANEGFQPNSPISSQPTVFQYQPDLRWEPAPLSGAAADAVTAHIRFTRWGLRGRDFGGPEVTGP